MAAAPRLTPEEWAKVRSTWENDPRDSFEWLVRELGLPIAGAAIRKRAKIAGGEWVKAGNASTDNDLEGKKAAPSKSAENAPKKPEAAPRQSQRDREGRGSAVGKPEGGEQSPPKGFKGAAVNRGMRKRNAKAHTTVIDMATGEPETEGSADGSQGSDYQGSGYQGSGQKWAMNLGSDEHLWRDTTPMVPPKDPDAKRGRPTVYQKLFAHQAFTFCLTGATNDDLAMLFQVSVRTINRWLIDHKEFCHAVQAGRGGADAKVATSLYKRAIGFSVPEAHVSNYKGVITITELEKYYPPDVGAATLWLTNRRPDLWRVNPEPPPPDPKGSMPYEKDLDRLYEQSMEESKTRAQKAREDRERNGLFGKGVGDGLDEELPLLPGMDEDD